MMLEKKYMAILVFSVLLISTVALSGCVDPDDEGEDTTKLRMGFAWPTEIDPATGTDKSSTVAFTNFYDPLVFPTQEGVKPWIAEDWDVSEDGMTWTFHLRDDVTFHSGNEMTAEDVMFSMERLVTMGEGFSYLFAPYINLNESEVVDDYTVRFQLNEPRGVFLSSLVRLYIVDEEEILDNAVEDGDFEYEPWDNDLGRNYLIENTAGTGPYEVYEAVVEDHFYGERFEDYWGPMAENAADEFRMLALGEAATERTLFGDQELEITSEWLEHHTSVDISEAHDGKVGAYPEGGALYGMMHTQKEPLDCIHVRKALAHVFDYESQIDDIFPESVLPKGIVPLTLGGASEMDMPRQDLTLAQESLEQSKYYPDIVENPEDYEIEASWTGAVPATEHVALMLAGDAEEIGLNVESNRYEWGALIDAMYDVESSPHIGIVWVSASYPEAGALLHARYHSRNSDSWEQNEWLDNEEIDNLIDEALAEPDIDERFELYEEVQEKIFELYPSIVMHDQYSMHVYQPYVTWPQAEDPEELAPPASGYSPDARLIEVLPHNER
ncbi:MAG: ABC transporter substrate-binding protein [Candidatus Saliniplasma sp.]